MPTVLTRHVPPDRVAALVAAGVPALVARIYAARGVDSPHSLAAGLEHLVAPDTMLNVRVMAGRVADAIASGKKLLIVADYDADGATACAVGMRALRAFGARVEFLVPNRFEYGYGLSPEIVRLAHARSRPDILITVDNGISSVEGVAEATHLGIETLITDHHLPGEHLPAATCIVNPNQPGCPFPSKHLAGVGVMFYLMLALRAELRERGVFARRHKSPGTRHEQVTAAPSSLIPRPSSLERIEPNLAELLPLVALGTIADVVPLDHNNRILVHQGLARMRSGRMQPGIAALLRAAGCDARRVGARDLAFALGPRLNAAGRLTDMSLGIECLLTDDEGQAQAIATQLDRLNRERRDIESGMQEEALAAIDGRDYGESYSLSLFDPAWHQGVIGIVAGRIKDRYHRPTVAFARGQPGEIRGSGRSIPTLHLRDALDQTAVRHPGLLLKFGGHAAAAGLTLREADFQRFSEAFEETARRLLSPADLDRVIETDGPLAAEHYTPQTIALLYDRVWGQGFPPPRFCDEFEVAAQRIVAEKHTKLALACNGRRVEAIRFNHTEALPTRIRAVYHPMLNEFNGKTAVQLAIEYWEGA
jgi:single-stranded-DNA-specific exonuclease